MIRTHLAAAGLVALLTCALPSQALTDPPSPKKKADVRGMMTGQSKQSDQRKKAVTYRNCAEVRRAGKAPLKRGQPGYGRHLDPDGDGIACK